GELGKLPPFPGFAPGFSFWTHPSSLAYRRRLRFSCKAFDMAQVLRKLTAVFEIGRYETYMINRGKEFPKDPELARKIVLGEREYLEARVS
ncbi:hypothetical protein, partial [Streptococcus pneumoniae]|uniref:hypothetical protein n=1 Tax=Streptococcus pneumoniae TaxID=1313 RepID=UPI001CB7AA61